MSQYATMNNYIRLTKEVIRDSFYNLDVSRWSNRCAKFSISQCSSALAYFNDHGWVIFRNVFTREEARNFREMAATSQQLGYKGDILSDPVLGSERFILHAKLLTIIKSMLSDTPVYFGDSSISFNSHGIGFHKDNPDRESQAAPDWKSPYTLIRVGTYLQDHKYHSGGLAIRDDSWHIADVTTGRPIALPLEVGDLAVWSLRTTHSGYAVRPRLVPGIFVPLPTAKLLSLEHRMNGKVASSIFRPMEFTDRIALFSTFGINDHHLRRFLAYLKTRQYAIKVWRSTAYNKAAIDAAADCGIKVIDMKDRVRSVDYKLLNSTHVPLSSAS